MTISLELYSNPRIAQKNAYDYLGKSAVLKPSTRIGKKYMIYDPDKNKHIHFGQLGYEDFTKHRDEKRRQNYMKRTENMKGNWKNNPYSPNNLSRNILWNNGN